MFHSSFKISGGEPFGPAYVRGVHRRKRESRVEEKTRDSKVRQF